MTAVKTVSWTPSGLDATHYGVIYETIVSGDGNGGIVKIEVPLPSNAADKRFQITVRVHQLDEPVVEGS